MLGTNTEDEAIMKDLVAMMKGDSQLLCGSQRWANGNWIFVGRWAVDPCVWEAIFVGEIWKKTMKTGKNMQHFAPSPS